MGIDADDLEAELDGTVQTVGDLNDAIADAIERDPDLAFDYLVGDVSDPGVSNGTLYFTLSDGEASIQCLAFSNVRSRLPAFDDEDRVAITGRLTYYSPRGQCSIYVDDVIPVGDSQYHEHIAALRATLEEEGLTDDDAKADLPVVPDRIGIVTAADSDAEEDAVTAIHGRFPTVPIWLCDARVQGDGAAETLQRAILYLDAHEAVDVIVVTRGGGSDRDFAPFNEEGVARLIAHTDTPVVTALGHETDRPVADDVADARAMTPTDLGEVLVPSQADRLEQAAQLRERAAGAYDSLVADRLATSRDRLEHAYATGVGERLTSLGHDLTAAYGGLVDLEVARLGAGVESAYTAHVDLALERRRNRVRTAYDTLERDREHAAETAALRRRERLYRIALLVLIMAVVVLVVLFTAGVL